uniref:Uncharacterized protein n=1 Tax=uncultured prokaryote TaxID=198431 RepID=A0A0H5Q6R1_9ZZZZ|nr:hypothetical protein [uncultured prokaryote]
MDTRIQFRISEDQKQLAQEAARLRGKTLSEACREFAEQLASEAVKMTPHEKWLKRKVDEAFDKVDSGEANFTSHSEVKSLMEMKKEEIRSKYKA